MGETYLRDDLRGIWDESTMLIAAAQLEGDLYRQVAGRSTRRVHLDGRWFFIKFHEGVGLGEVLKSWLSLKHAVCGARNEYEACKLLERESITAPRVAAFAETSAPAAWRRSFVMCDALEGYEDLEAITNRWHEAPPGNLSKRHLVIQVAEFARRFHSAGLVHRDFYLCHLLRQGAEPDTPLGVLDLHRALRFRKLPERWRSRDLAALLYSSLDLPVCRSSWLRFVRIYSARPLAEEFAQNGRFWNLVYQRALKLYAKGGRKGLTRGKFQP